MLPSLRYALHPVLPEKLGFRALLRAANPSLATALAQTDGFTLVPGRSRVTLARAAQSVLDAGVPGSFVEFGVHRGGTAGMLAHILRHQPERELHLFDRWGDLPEPTENDGFRQQQYARGNIPEKLADLIERPPLDATRHLLERVMPPGGPVHYYQGWYDATIGDFKGTIAFASIDCDYYESVKLVLSFVAAHASAGCVMVVDDYEQWPGARQATDEFCAARGIAPEVLLNQAVLRLGHC